MPIYEYRCGHCGRVSSFFTRAISHPLEPECRHCQSRDMHRRISTVAVGKTARYGMETPESVREVIEAARQGDLPKGLDE